MRRIRRVSERTNRRLVLRYRVGNGSDVEEKRSRRRVRNKSSFHSAGFKACEEEGETQGTQSALKTESMVRYSGRV